MLAPTWGCASCAGAKVVFPALPIAGPMTFVITCMVQCRTLYHVDKVYPPAPFFGYVRWHALGDLGL